MSFSPGTKVVLKPQYARAGQAGQVYTVRKMLNVNLEVENDKGQVLRGKPHMFEATGESTPYIDIVRKLEAAPTFILGEVVTVPRAPATKKWHYLMGQKFVVIAIRDRTVNIAKLGGDNDRYWRLDPHSLEKAEV